MSEPPASDGDAPRAAGDARPRFRHDDALWRSHPGLAAAVLHVRGVRAIAHTQPTAGAHLARALARLDGSSEGEWPEIQAWRRAFSWMGLKPTQYRCAAEALLRRLRKERSLPAVHPMVDLCNAVSAAHATPIAVFDLAHVAGALVVQRATGGERYREFSGAIEIETPSPGEVVFVDDAGEAHARRWSHRQSAASAVRDDTDEVLVVAEALHDTARRDIDALLATLAREIEAHGGTVVATAVLHEGARRFG